MKIVLLGYMGSGKSAIGSLLSQKLQISFYDLDNEIEKIEQIAISEIFKTKGEIYFRKKENEVLKAILALEQDFVLSLGGGTPCYYNNIELLKAAGLSSYYLKATTDTLVKRLMDEKNSRPLLHNQDENSLKDFINKHLFDRNYYYHQATKIVNVDDKTIEEISNEISDALT
ncbi:shikimate kinase [Flavobacterium ardleyense]|uniref:Shikimate kinase n=1 Tax=Flavobacterium ardleyense TaxID=2038737 RepID=A0ABW5Z5J3_9FLAO